MDGEGFGERHAFPPFCIGELVAFFGFMVFCPKKAPLFGGDGLGNRATFIVDLGIDAARFHSDIIA